MTQIITLTDETHEKLVRLAALKGLSAEVYLEQLIAEQVAAPEPAENPFAALIGIVDSEKTDISSRVTQIMQGFAEKYHWKPADEYRPD